jgi:hypothetical protein
MPNPYTVSTKFRETRVNAIPVIMTYANKQPECVWSLTYFDAVLPPLIATNIATKRTIIPVLKVGTAIEVSAVRSSYMGLNFR